MMTRPETHQNLIYSNKEQNHRRVFTQAAQTAGSWQLPILPKGRPPEAPHDDTEPLTSL
jgi:hypothetical protein